MVKEVCGASDTKSSNRQPVMLIPQFVILTEVRDLVETA